MSNLLMEKGNFVDRSTVLTVPTPEPVGQHHPISHGVLLHKLETVLGDRGYRVTEETHGLEKDGARYFGILQLELAGSDGADLVQNTNFAGASSYKLLAGIRNAHDKSIAAGFALGARVMVCSNLSFSGEFVLSRRHTLNIMRDLDGLVHRSVAQLVEHRGNQHKRFEAYCETRLTDSRVNDVIIDALDSRVVPASKIPAVLEHWRKPPHEEFEPRNVWSLFNSFTEVFKTNAAETTLKRSQTLHDICDGVCGLAV